MPEEPYAIPFGEANIVREGYDVTDRRARPDGARSPSRPPSELAERGHRVRDRRPAHDVAARHGDDPRERREHRPARRRRRGEPALRHRLRHRRARSRRRRFGDLKAPPRMVTPPHTPVPVLARRSRTPTSRRRTKIADAVREDGRGRQPREHESDPEAGHAQVGPVDDGGHGSSSGSSRRAPRSPSATRWPRSRPRRSTASVEAPAAGVLRRRVAGEGDVMPVGGLLGVIADAERLRRRHRRVRRRVQATLRARRGRARTPAPAPETVDVGRHRCAILHAGRGRRAGRAPARLRRRPQQLAVQRRRRSPSDRAGLRARPARATAARPRTSATATLAELAAPCAEFLDALGHRARRTSVGHSMGGAGGRAAGARRSPGGWPR